MMTHWLKSSYNMLVSHKTIDVRKTWYMKDKLSWGYWNLRWYKLAKHSNGPTTSTSAVLLIYSKVKVKKEEVDKLQMHMPAFLLLKLITKQTVKVNCFVNNVCMLFWFSSGKYAWVPSATWHLHLMTNTEKFMQTVFCGIFKSKSMEFSYANYK